MFGFVEKTVAEQGFASSWKMHMSPLIDAAVKRQRRQMMFASLVTGLALGLGVVALFLGWLVTADGLFAQPLFMALILALAALAAIASWVPHLRRDSALQDGVMAAVESHFAALVTPDENTAFAEVILQDLVSDGVLDPAEHQIMTHHAGSYRGCRIRLFAARACPLTEGRRPGRGQDLLVARVSLPWLVDCQISIDSDFSRLSADGERLHVDHDQFDHIFGVSCGNQMVAADVLTTRLAESFLMIQQRLANPLSQKATGLRVSVQIADGNLLLLIEEAARDGGAGQLGPAALEALARDLVMRFAMVPGLVDELYGDTEHPPAFTALAGMDHTSPQISV